MCFLVARTPKDFTAMARLTSQPTFKSCISSSDNETYWGACWRACSSHLERFNVGVVSNTSGGGVSVWVSVEGDMEISALLSSSIWEALCGTDRDLFLPAWLLYKDSLPVRALGDIPEQNPGSGVLRGEAREGASLLFRTTSPALFCRWTMRNSCWLTSWFIQRFHALRPFFVLQSFPLVLSRKDQKDFNWSRSRRVHSGWLLVVVPDVLGNTWLWEFSPGHTPIYNFVNGEAR